MNADALPSAWAPRAAPRESTTLTWACTAGRACLRSRTSTGGLTAEGEVPTTPVRLEPTRAEAAALDPDRADAERGRQARRSRIRSLKDLRRELELTIPPGRPRHPGWFYHRGDGRKRRVPGRARADCLIPFCYRRRTPPLPARAQKAFPSWTPPVRPRSPALVRELPSHGLPSRSVMCSIGEPASGAGDPKMQRT
jgi:hypothetical protein